VKPDNEVTGQEGPGDQIKRAKELILDWSPVEEGSPVLDEAA